jgi:hypothetical protein
MPVKSNFVGENIKLNLEKFPLTPAKKTRSFSQSKAL